MDYLPRYPQPFTLAEAIALDVSVISEEITRLQHSLRYLRQTQDTLHEHVASEKPEDIDPEISKALEENEDVIASQEERISILKMALAEKGVHAQNHYDLAPSTQMQTQPIPVGSSDDRSESGLGEGESGVHL
ncbi:hypothetical protein BDZ94DRAFT_1256489 [Collybia nuda]|uniref:Uncharacterized protein n=1 Tax=Collybia nuda TaxID=64659 RepID=A0A9P5Y952_9AGAR|nr:hypothetical protein BDZ94DRAFT_1256489 [Collybia nuda]